MEQSLPAIFIALAAVTLLLAIAFLWSSLRALFGADTGALVGRTDAVRKRGELLDEKEAVLRSLKDLEFERDVGKLSDEDFARLDAEFRQRAKQIMRLLDDDLKAHREKAKALIASEVADVEPSA
jgi:hypothetical protein